MPVGDVNSVPPIPVSVAYYFTRVCNLKCKNSTLLPIEQAKKGLRMLADAGMRKITFAGGEPFSQPAYLGVMVKFCKLELRLQSVGIITNGSRVTDTWLKQFGSYLDMLGVSCDSFDDDTNVKIGRSAGGYRGHIRDARRISEWCHDNDILFKLTTVVNQLNWEEDMNDGVKVLNPYRWKAFQCLILDGENSGSETSINDARDLVITAEQFKAFVDRHKGQPNLFAESSELMKDSYLLLDEEMRFLDCSTGGKIPGRSLLEVGVDQALRDGGFDQEAFDTRGGIYNWSKPAVGLPAQEPDDGKYDW